MVNTLRIASMPGSPETLTIGERGEQSAYESDQTDSHVSDDVSTANLGRHNSMFIISALKDMNSSSAQSPRRMLQRHIPILCR
jgi:hypothetical protein